MLPPGFWALAGIADNTTPTPATRNIRASALERIAAFIDTSSQISPVRYSGSLVAARKIVRKRSRGQGRLQAADEKPQN
jgi:hypothetical protein